MATSLALTLTLALILTLALTLLLALTLPLALTPTLAPSQDPNPNITLTPPQASVKAWASVPKDDRIALCRGGEVIVEISSRRYDDPP